MARASAQQASSSRGSAWAESILSGIPGYDPRLQADGYVFDEERARRAIEFFPVALRHIEGAFAGTPFNLEAWQQAIVGNLFGWVDSAGFRRYRRALLYVPRKNGKTPLAAGISLYVLCCDAEQGQVDTCAAADREQAALLFRHAAGMVRQNAELDARCSIYGEHGGGQTRKIEYPATNSELKVISADAGSKHGGNPHLIIVDELHAQRTPDLVRVLETSMASEGRKQSLMLYITTADYDRDSICNEVHGYACSVRDNRGKTDEPGYDPQFLPVIYETPLEADWTDPEVWAAANPNLGVSVSLPYMERACKEAREIPSKENEFKRLHLDMKTQQDVRWLSLEAWDACTLAIDDAELKREPCYGGLDLSSTTDLTAFALYWPSLHALKLWCWCPRDNAKARQDRDKVPYLTWANGDLLNLTDGNTVDQRKVAADIGRICGAYKVKDIGVDPWRADQIEQELMQAGLNVFRFGMTIGNLAGPTDEFERLVLGGLLRHGGNPMLRWMAGNVSIETDKNENKRPVKSKSTERIDGIVASIVAIGRSLAHDGGPDVSKIQIRSLW